MAARSPCPCEADESEIVRLEAAATAEPSDDLDERLWGPAPDSVTAVKAVVADLSEQFSQRRRLAADSISREDAAELLGIAAQSVTSKLVSGKLSEAVSSRGINVTTISESACKICIRGAK